MSHRSDQPYELPPTEVEHGFAVDDYAWGDGFLPSGTIRDEEFWGWESKAAEDAYWRERRRADEARAKLGGFGFRGAA